MRHRLIGTIHPNNTDHIRVGVNRRKGGDEQVVEGSYRGGGETADRIG